MWKRRVSEHGPGLADEFFVVLPAALLLEWVARLFEKCDYADLPPSVVKFLFQVFSAMPKIKETPHPDDEAATAAVASDSA